MSDLGLLMTDAMALACYEGRKTVARKPSEWARHFPLGQELDMPNGFKLRGAGTAKIGGRVWIRECFAVEIGVLYRASGDTLHHAADGWRPSIHMPKWAARTWGRIVSVRPERLQDITDADAKREGCTDGLVACGMLPHVAAFRSVWTDCYATRGLGWNANPWVWRIEWERIERPSDL